MTQQNQNPNQPSNSGFTFEQKIILLTLMLVLASVVAMFITVWQIYEPKAAPQVIVVTATPQLVLPTAANTRENSASNPTAIFPKMKVVETVLPNGTRIGNYVMVMPDGTREVLPNPTRDLTAMPRSDENDRGESPQVSIILTRLFSKLTPQVVTVNGTEETQYGFPLPDGSFQIIPAHLLSPNPMDTPQPVATQTYEAIIGQNFSKYLGIVTPDLTNIPLKPANSP